MSIRISVTVRVSVTPLAGVWIEINTYGKGWSVHKVTPLAGVWIEIAIPPNMYQPVYVTPLAGVWIEIEPSIRNILEDDESLPLRECGLK